MKKPPSKVAHNRPPTFFLCTGPAAQTAKKQKSCTTKSPLMQDWVFRLGFNPNIIWIHSRVQLIFKDQRGVFRPYLQLSLPKCTLSHRAIAHGHLGLKLQRKCFLFLIKKQHHHVKKHYAQKCTKAKRNFPIMYLDSPPKIFQCTIMKRLREYWATLCVQNLILHHRYLILQFLEFA